MLAGIDSAAQNAALFAAAQALSQGRWYIGYNDRSEENVWVWADGETRVFTTWAAGDPDDFGEEDCATLDPYAEGSWSDVPCATVLPFVCALDEEL